jgi:MFS superfamily sulfate permease-like transporter
MTFKDIKFNRQEFSGSLGDIGTDFPLIVAMILAAGLHTPSVLIVFGLMQIFTGLIYKMPMPVQPLKAMATLVISQKIAGNVLLGAGLAIGVVMLVLTLTGVLDKLANFVPKAVIRGLQLGLGISLCLLSVKQYIPSGEMMGYVLAAIAFLMILLFIDNKQYPASLLVIGMGIVYAILFNTDFSTLPSTVSLNLPQFHLPSIDDVAKGFVLLALPQIPLSLGNSIMATKQVSDDLFPQSNLSVKKIGVTYSLMNLFAPFFSGIPCCHGAGGMVGHYTFGGRTGGSVIIYGLLYLSLGLFFGNSFEVIVKIFPLPILGVILLFEGISLMLLIKDVVLQKRDFVITILTGILAFGLPYGFLVAIVVGTALFYSPLSLKTLTDIGNKKA